MNQGVLHRLENKRLLTRNMVLNLLGQGAPLLVALISVPLLIKGLGIERFGILTIVWVLVGYLSILDFGLGRALIHFIAQEISGSLDSIAYRVIASGLIAMAMIGVVASLLGILVFPWIIENYFQFSADLLAETKATIYLIALAVPFTISSVGMRGLLEAQQRFDIVNGIRIPLGIMNYLGPLLIIPVSRSLVAAALVLVSIRVIAWIVYVYFMYRCYPELRQTKLPMPSLNTIRPLLRFGGMVSISNVLASITLYVDRFFVASILGTAQVAYYTTPFDAVTKLWVIPTAIMGVSFPALTSWSKMDLKRVRELYHRSMRVIFWLVTPAALVIIIFAQPLLNFWLGRDFSEQSHAILQILAAGVLINCLAQCSFGLIQAMGKPKITALFHIIETPIYVMYMVMLTSTYGLIGTALAWFIRVLLGGALLFVTANFILKNADESITNTAKALVK